MIKEVIYYCTLFLVIISMVIFITSCTQAQPRVIDGDSYKFRNIEFRLACINAFEYDHPKGEEAIELLKYWMPHVTKVERVKQGYFDRTIVFLWAGEELVNAKIYQAGLARFYWDYPCKYKDLILDR